MEWAADTDRSDEAESAYETSNPSRTWFTMQTSITASVCLRSKVCDLRKALAAFGNATVDGRTVLLVMVRLCPQT
jgi:hypothetical protein